MRCSRHIAQAFCHRSVQPHYYSSELMSSPFFRCYNVLTQHSGHLQTIYTVLGDFSAVDQVVYDRQVVSHYYTNHQLIFTLAGGFSKPKMAEPCRVIWFNLEELRSLLQQGSRLHTACFRPCPSGRNTDHCSFTRPDWWSVLQSDCCLIVGSDAV